MADGSAKSARPTGDTVKRALARIDALERELATLRAADDPVAIVGIGCRFPGAEGPDAFWDMLVAGRDATGPVPADRWTADAFYDADPAAAGRSYARAGGYLARSPEEFDAAAFGIMPVEAHALDPQQRMLLEVSLEAFEHAGLAPERLKGSRTGVFVGLSQSDYASHTVFSGAPEGITAYDVTGSIGSTAAGRLSYVWDLRGPSVAVDTACSSSLVAVDMAVQALRRREADAALAGGVNVILGPETGICFSRMQALAPDGKCKTFSAEADGFARAEGCGLVVLKRLSDAQRDGDRVLGVIRATCVNQDGRSNGLTAPSVEAQKALLAESLSRAGLEAADIGYLEAHGTGTPLGDPIEIEAVEAVLLKDRPKAAPLVVGSVKTNIGHAETAAGIAGLIKAVLALGHETIPPHLHCATPSPHIPWDRLPLTVAREAVRWPRGQAPRRAGISSFGFGGTNVHVIVEEAPPAPAVEDIAPGPAALCLSARTPEGLAALSARWVEWLTANSDLPAPAIAAAALRERARHPHRLSVTGASPAALAEALGTAKPGKAEGRPRVVFAFTGQGSQFAGMGADLYAAEPAFRKAFDACAEHFREPLGLWLPDAVFTTGDEAGATLQRTGLAQPALFAVEWALAALLKSRGITPWAVVGHSIGEYPAAVLAGAMSLPDACALVAARAKAMDALPEGGAMVAVQADEATVRAALEKASPDGAAAIAAINAPKRVVVSGEAEAVAAVVAALEAEGVRSTALKVSHAFHSPRMDAALPAVEAAAQAVTLKAPRLPFASTLTGDASADLTTAAYWSRQLRAPVRFSQACAHLADQGATLFLEVGPGPVLTMLGPQATPGTPWTACLERGKDGPARFAEALGRLFVHGAPVAAPGRGRPPSLPTLPHTVFERRRFWRPRTITPTPSTATAPRTPTRQETPMTQTAATDVIRSALLDILHANSGLADIDPAVNLIELGLDSLMLMSTRQQIAERWGLEIPISDFIETLNTADAIAAHIAAHAEPGAVAVAAVPAAPAPAAAPAGAGLLDWLTETIKADAGLETDDPDANLIEVGIDSLILMTARQQITETFGIEIPISHFFEDMDTLRKIAAHLEAQGARLAGAPAAAPAAAAPAREGLTCSITARPAAVPAQVPQMPAMPAAPAVQAEGLPQLFAAQLQALTTLMAQQNALLSGQPASPAATPAAPALSPPAAPAPTAPVSTPAPTASPAPGVSVPASVGQPETFVPYKAIRTDEDKAATDALQRQHLKELAEAYTAITGGSKERTQRFRQYLANNRNIAGFRPSWKEMVYQLVVEHAEGSRIREVGGREFIDLTMGFGVHLFGHKFKPIHEAVAKEWTKGAPLGPMWELAGPVAEDICAMTGMERVAFYNTGTEAVMVALRIARTATQRNRIVIFEGSYHGSFDGILALRREKDGQPVAVPGSPGTPQSMVDDVVVLRYDDPASLDYIRAHGHDLAGVLVEPVQSRRPDMRPQAFLQELRAITEQTGTCLIFDEVVSGFRVHPGGAQAVFGVRADLATYGKVIGGGLPVGLVAGKAAFMDAVDGGYWRYGDDSYPTKRNTFVAGTFCHHPLVLAAMRAVLDTLKAEGPELHERLNRKTSDLCTRINRFMEDNDVAIRVANFGSLFRFFLRGDADLLFYHLIARGIYVWEGRNCFLSTAHTDEDIEAVYRAVVEGVEALRAGGFLPRAHAAGGQPKTAHAPALPAAPVKAESKGLKRTPADIVKYLAPETIHRTEVSAPLPDPAEMVRSRTDFSLYCFASAEDGGEEGYRILLDAAKFADTNGFAAIWVPERHFHAFGGLSPNPAVAGGAIVAVTERVRLRTGCSVTLLHHPVRYAEDWAMIDRMSGGRVDIGVALGWNPNDFVFTPDNFERRNEILPEMLDTVRRLWRGETVTFNGGKGEPVPVEIFPKPVNGDIPLWFTAPKNPDTFVLCGRQGVPLLTYLETMSVDDLAERIRLYHAAWKEAGHPGRGYVTLMMHTLVLPDAEEARALARPALKKYLRSAWGLRSQLVGSLGMGLDAADESDVEAMLDRSVDRYLDGVSLIGSPETCAEVVATCKRIGVDELTCLIDFGLDEDTVRRGLPHLAELKDLTQGAPDPDAPTPGKARAPKAAEKKEALAAVPFPDVPAVALPDGRLALSDGQKEMWFLTQATPAASLAYNEMALLKLSGPLDLDCLDAALAAVVARHEALRITALDGTGQTVADRVDATVEVVDLTGLDELDRDAALAERLEAEARRPFRFDAGPLWRLVAVRVGGTDWRLLFSGHHIVTNGWSIALVLDEVARLYSDPAAALPAPTPFTAYIAWEAARGDKRAANAHWWKEHLDPPAPALALPVDYPETGRPTFTGGRVTLTLDGEALAAVRKLAGKHKATLFMVLLAGWQGLLARLTGQERIAVGVPVSGQAAMDRACLAGQCSTMLPAVVDAAPDSAFANLIGAVRKSMASLYEHQEVSLAALAAEGVAVPSLSAMFNLDSVAAAPDFAGLTAEPELAPIARAKFDLALNALAMPRKLVLDLDYRQDLFAEDTVAAWLETLRLMLLAAAEAPETALSALPAVAPAALPVPVPEGEPVPPGLEDGVTIDDPALSPFIRERLQQADAATTAAARALIDALELTADDVIRVTATPADDIILAARLTGACLGRISPPTIVDLPEHLLPDTADLSDVRVLLVSGAPLLAGHAARGPNAARRLGALRSADGRRTLALGPIREDAARGDRVVFDRPLYPVPAVSVAGTMAEGVRVRAEGRLDGTAPDTDAHVAAVLRLACRDAVVEGATAWVVLEDDTTLADIRATARDLLPPALVPAHLVPVTAIPDAARVDPVRGLGVPLPEAVPREAAEGDTAGRLCLLWADLLGRPVAADDGFLELGGNSLKATQLLLRVKRTFGVGLALADIFAAPTPAAMAALIDSRRDDGPALPAIPSAGEQEDYPLSAAQHRMWMHQRMQPDSVVYAVPVAVMIEGALDVDRLRDAFAAVQKRHDALRLRFIDRDGEPRQLIEPDPGLPFSTETPAEGDPETVLTEQARTLAQQPLDLEAAPPLRAILLPFAEDRHGLVLNAHHIITDGWSLAALLREVAGIYEAGEAGPAPTLRYVDYAAWQAAAGGIDAGDRAFWRKTLAAPLPVLDLPADHERPESSANPGRTAFLSLPVALAEGVRGMAAERATTPFVVLTAAVKALLFRLSEQTDQRVATPVAGRVHPDLEPVHGLFVNTVILRDHIDGAQGFGALVDAVRGTTLAALDHAACPLDQVIADLDLPRDWSRAPLADVLVALHDESELRLEWGGLSLRQLPLPMEAVPFDLLFQFIDTGAAIDLRLDYRADLYAPERIRLWQQRLLALLMDALAAPDKALSALDVDTKPTRRRRAGSRIKL
ncbi:Malonyl CoA-acyl carrier protein transacylase [Caenispirillum salinarum AK4]|uniref:Malonyl CoA-acyl carrier protein transacylase n=1 Tax=Caenispirillum salinarum AK4 TaxID=1238182 RepID=K9GV21_9PROT|nr:type I polyketide synthase [Caenispirillum salinarum]EKV29840.1 Malonyl CoA-acyl carrier protein transacylase [Caenispirillum salinarum AK4]